MKNTIIISLALALLGCKETSIEADRYNGLYFTTDRTSYYFTNDSVKDPVYLTFFNATDSIVYQWWPSLLQFKTDTGWKYLSVSCGGFQDPPLLPNRSISKRWAVDGRISDGTPEGEYRFVAEVQTDTTKGFQLIPSNSFFVRYK